MAQECPVCIMKLNKTTRAPVTCPDPQCGWTCCRSCLQEYIVTHRHDPKCMSCSKAFSRMHLQTIMPATWIKGQYIKERASILLEREKSMIPDTMPWVEAETTARGMEAEITTLHDKMDELRQQLATIGGEINARRQAIVRLRDGELSTKSRTKKFIVKCPDCPAFVNKSGKCTSCAARICMHCRDKLIVEDSQYGTVDDIIVIEPPPPAADAADAADVADAADAADAADEDDEEDEGDARDPMRQYHVCDKSTLATARMIENDTKPCPKCGNRIHKIEGCDQMFDPHCGTAFSWKTGQIVTGVIHNPHYFQWQRNNGGVVARQPGDVLCGGPPGMHDVYSALGWTPSTHDVQRALNANLYGNGKGILWPASNFAADPKNIELINDIKCRWTLANTGRILLHIQDVELPRLATTWDQTTNRALRVQYVLNEYSEKFFASELAQRERTMEKHREIQQIFDTFLQGGTDILRKFIAQFIEIDHSHAMCANNKKLISLMEFMGEKKPRIGTLGPNVLRHWWCLANDTIKYKRRHVSIQHMYIPRKEIIQETFNEIIALQQFCNEEFCKISKAWKLVAPIINVKGDYVSQKRWYHTERTDPGP